MYSTEPYRSAPPGTVDEATCEVCGSACALVRGVMGPTSWASAMSRRPTLHDHIRCPHLGSSWHLRAYALQEAIRATPSPRVAALMQQDLEELLAAHLGAAPPTAP